MSSVSLSASATFIVNGEEVLLKSDDIGKGLKFSIDKPVELGSFNDFTDWLKTSWDIQGDFLPQEDDRKAWPPSLAKAYDALTKGIVSIDVLNIDTSKGSFQLGISFTLVEPLPLIGPLSFKRMGLVFSRTAISSNLAEDVKDDATELTVTKDDGQKFNKDASGKVINDLILIDKEYMKVNKVEGDKLTVDRAQPPTAGSAKSDKTSHSKDAIILVQGR